MLKPVTLAWLRTVPLTISAGQAGKLFEQCGRARAGIQSFTVHAYDYAISDVPLIPQQYSAITRRVPQNVPCTSFCSSVEMAHARSSLFHLRVLA